MIGRRRRIDENLLADRKLSAIARHERYSCRQVTASTISHEHDILRMDPKLFRMLIDRARRRIAVLQTDRKRVFGCTPIFDRCDLAPSRFGKPPAYLIVGVYTLKHPAAAMEKQQQPALLCLARCIVKPHTDRGPVNRLDLVIPQMVKRGNGWGLEAVKHTLNFINLFQVSCRRIGQQPERRAHMFIDCH